MFLSPTQDAPRSAHIDIKHKAVLKENKEAKVVILKPQCPISADTSDWRDDFVLQPYFFALARSAEEPNMRHATVKADGIEIPILTNHRPIKQWEQIVASEEGDMEQAKKKAKK